MKKGLVVSFLGMAAVALLCAGPVGAADVVPPEIEQPGTQPGEVGNFESPDKCDNCHGGYDCAIYSNEPAFGWRGSAMGNAGRDPIFWATLAIAEQDFDGSGDLCIRCHSTGGWYAGRSTPTDGSGLAAGDDDGVDCDTCHKMTNPDNSEHLGVMNDPFIANQGDNPGPGSEGYYGSGMLSIWGGSDKLGPYIDAEARHQFMQSEFHRGDICGSCHDVSNPAVGDLAPNNGAQPTADPVISSGGNLGGPVGEKAAFNNPPYAYGIVERTFSEWKSGALDTMDVRNFPNLPADLQAESGALNMAYQSAMLAGGTYEDGTPRTFTCQGCHMRADVGEGCNKNPPTRSDLPKHDLTGGNYWVWPLIKYQDQQGTLRLGGDLTQTQIDAMDAGQIRGEDQLQMAASLEVIGNSVKITNLTGHKLISGYPEGRRMWLNVKWYDSAGLLREDGAYGPLCRDGIDQAVSCDDPTSVGPVSVTFTDSFGVQKSFQPESIIDLHDPNTKIYEVHPAITQGWAAVLNDLPGKGAIPIGYDRLTGDTLGTIAELAAGTLGPYAKSFHFVLNNYVAEDNRIPPYGMDYETARVRNALPVPDTQYGGGPTYDYWDTVALNPPAGATGADITLYYQGTSWEYVQFLWLANTTPAGSFLADEGVNMLDAWVNADPAAPMVPPFPMATASWGDACAPTGVPEDVCNGVDDDCDGLIDEDFVTTPSTCGLGECASSGEVLCVDGVVQDTCTPPPAPEPGTELTCDDGLDNDCDGFTDGGDTDCGGMACADYATRGDCNNDPNCIWEGSRKNGMCVDNVPCVPEPEICDDGIDNDCDGLTDCADTADCGNDPVCQIDCSVYSTKNLCNAQPACSWSNKDKACLPL